jgi:uncharacterized protein
MNPAQHVLKGAVVTYQWTLRPFIGANCRFHPSCSHYAIEAVTEHGALKGAGMAAWRILRCNPWNAGGYDPVPPRPARPGVNRLRTAPADSSACLPAGPETRPES